MQISLIKNTKTNYKKIQHNSKPNFNYLNLKQLKTDTISFASMKKTQFNGIDKLVVEKFKAPIEKFNTINDFYNWADEKIDKEIVLKDFKARTEEGTLNRKKAIKEWVEYVRNKNTAYTPAIALLILSNIVLNLKEDNENFPPVLNKRVLADTVSFFEETIKFNPRAKINFNKIYETRLRANYFDDDTTTSNNDITGWIKISSQKNDPENFEANVEKLKALSYKSWCTKSFNAKPYLSEGDFHIYFENGKPKLGVRFIGKEIEEIQGELNNGAIPNKYFEIFKKHIEKENIKLTKNAQDEVNRAEKTKIEIEKFKRKLGNKIKLETVDDAQKIFNYFGIKTQKIDNDKLIISHYKQPEDYTFSDLEINESKLFKYVHKIKGDADFFLSEITNLNNLTSIEGKADFNQSEITDLGKLTSIGGNADFRYSKINNLGILENIEGNANFEHSEITNLNHLMRIGGTADFKHSKVENLGKLCYVGGNCIFTFSQITNLSNLIFIKGNADFRNSKVNNLGYLYHIGGNVWLANSKIDTSKKMPEIKGKIYE